MAGPTSAAPAVAAKPFKQPFKAVAALSRKTGELTKPVDPVLDRTVDFFFSGYSTAKTKTSHLSKRSTYLLALFALVATGAIALFLLIPALIFFPITILLGIFTSIGLLAITPVALVVGWIVLSSGPIQAKVVGPALDNALKNDRVKKLLLVE